TGEEGNASLVGRGAGEERLAGAGLAREEDPARWPATETREALRVLQEGHRLHQRAFRLVHPGDAIETAALELGLAHVEMILSARAREAHRRHGRRGDEEHADPEADALGAAVRARGDVLHRDAALDQITHEVGAYGLVAD